MSARGQARRGKPPVAWKAGDKAWQVDDFGKVHAAVLRSEPYRSSDHWSVQVEGIAGGYLADRFYKSLYWALMAGIRQAQCIGGGADLVARAEQALGAFSSTYEAKETPEAIAQMRARGLLGPAREVRWEGGWS